MLHVAEEHLVRGRCVVEVSLGDNLLIVLAGYLQERLVVRLDFVVAEEAAVDVDSASVIVVGEEVFIRDRAAVRMAGNADSVC